MGTSDVYGYDVIELTTGKVLKVVKGEAVSAAVPDVVELATGTPAVPSLTFQADTNTGIYYLSSGAFAVVSNGVEVARFTATGAQLTGLLTGTSVQASATDTTANRLLKVGAFGWGATTPPAAGTTSLDTITMSGLHYVATADIAAVNGPATAGAGVVLTLRWSANNAAQTFYEIAAQGRVWSRQETTGTWSAWRLIANGTSIGTAANVDVQTTEVDDTTGRVVAVGGFGLGATTPSLLGNTGTTTTPMGWYRTDATTLGGFPVAAGAGSLRMERQGTGGLYQEWKEATSENRWIRYYNGAAWSAWRRLLWSGDTTGILSGATLGWTTGAGGTVTQVTSKATSVTRNTSCGEIVMHNAALAAGAAVTFTFNNSLLVRPNTLVIDPAAFGFYEVNVLNHFAGGANIRVQNISGSSQSDALPLYFAVLQGVVT